MSENKINEEKRTRRGKLYDLQNAIVQEYQNGKTLAQIAAQYNCSAAAIRSVLMRSGIARRQRSRRKLSEDEFRSKYCNTQAKTLKAFAREVGICEITVKRYLARLGLENKFARGKKANAQTEVVE